MNVRRALSLMLLAVAGPLAVAQATPAAKPNTPAPVKASTSKAALLDINTASTDQLTQLPGIGDAYAKRIVDGRPYTAKNQLVSRGIVPQKTYDGISGQIIAKHQPKAAK